MNNIKTDIEHDIGLALIEFVVQLRRSCDRYGLHLSATTATDIVDAWTRLSSPSPQALYLAARAFSVHAPEELAIFDLAFGAALTNDTEFGDDEEANGSEEKVSEVAEASREGMEGTGEQQVLSYSRVELLRERDIATLCVADRDVVDEMIAEMVRVRVLRLGHRTKRSSRREQMIDLQKSVARARAHDGEIIELSFRRRRIDLRRVVFLLDVSGSMELYVPMYLRVITAVASGGVPTEAFSLGTRLTRLTRALEGHDQDRSLQTISAMVHDWSGGTRLGESLEHFNQTLGIRGLARSATVVIFSDGLDRGDPELLGDQMARLARVAHQVIWVNPLRGLEGYAPLARGMRACLPSIDQFVSGHSLAAIAELLDLLARGRKILERPGEMASS